MKLLQYIFAAVLIVLIGGFAFFAVIDVPVQQKNITLDIKHEG